MRVIDVHTLKRERETGSVPVLIDVRTPAEYNNGHVPDTVHIPLQELTDRLDDVAQYKEDTVYLICQAGGRSGKAAQYLEGLGYDVVNVMGGTGGWIQAGYGVEK